MSLVLVLEVLVLGSGMDEARTLPFKDTSSLQDIHFKFDRDDLDDESRATLRRKC